MALTVITPAIAKTDIGNKEKSCWYPFTTPGSREAIVDKMPCLGAYAPGGFEPWTLWLRGESTLHQTHPPPPPPPKKKNEQMKCHAQMRNIKYNDRIKQLLG